MAKTDPQVEKFFQIVNKINAGVEISDDEYLFYYQTTPTIDDELIQKYIDETRKSKDDPNYKPDPQILRDGLLESMRKIQSDPVHKERTLKLVESQEAKRSTDKIAEGLNLILGGTDIANSINQIRQANQASKRSRKPSRPAIPQRDVFLEQALRGAEENAFEAYRATAPVEQQIQDQYLEDVQNAKVASTGQAGAYGAYRQLAANRRNRAATQLAPIQDEIRRGQQARYDSLLGQRLDETQQMYRNQAYLYPQDLQQYNTEQQAAANLGSTGRLNLRDSLYNMANASAGYLGQNSTRRRYDALRNQAMAAGLNPDTIVQTRMDLDNNVTGKIRSLSADDNINYLEQMYM